MADRFYVGTYNNDSGLQTNLKPYAIPDTAFSTLNNAYVFRGRVRKRFGSRWLGDDQTLSRLRVNIGQTDMTTGDFTGNVPLNTVPNPIATPAIGQIFSIGTNLFTVNALGAPANLLRTDGIVDTATFDTTSGDVVINGSTPDTGVYYYPALPVMGLLTFEDTNDQRIIGFDTRFAYQYAGGWERLSGEVTPGAASWTGTNINFFWGTTWTADAFTKIFFVTNFNENEPNFMRILTNSQWDNFRPAIDGSLFLNSARILVVFKNRLVAFNTWEGASSPGSNYINRARYAQIGSPLDTDAWRQDIPGRGSAIDAPTAEAIITIEFIKDRLIVFFERSTYEFVYTGNQAFPFTWQKINTELGAESTFSVVPFDKVAIGIGNVGVHFCNGTNVDRLDQNIPDIVFGINQANNGVERVYGIRDYFTEMIYWAFPNNQQPDDFPYPNRILLYNYKNATWSFNIDSITAFGYFLPQGDVIWDSSIITWDDDIDWDSSTIQGQVRQVIAGNQEGYTFLIFSDETTNASVIQITDISVTANIVTITAIDHNMAVGDYVYLSGITDSTGNLTLLNNKIFQIINSGGNPITVNTFSFIYDATSDVLAGTYVGGGLLSRVSNMVIATKQYNFYAQEGRNAFISKIDFMVDKTDAGQLQVEFYASTSFSNLLLASQNNGSLLGTGTLDTFAYPLMPYEADATRLWHSSFISGEGECIQLVLTMNDAQMRDVSIREADFELHAICFQAQKTSRLQ